MRWRDCRAESGRPTYQSRTTQQTHCGLFVPNAADKHMNLKMGIEPFHRFAHKAVFYERIYRPESIL